MLLVAEREEDVLAPPLLVAEGWDLTFFRSAESLAGYIEPWFPPDVDYQAWDARGRRLELVVEATPPSRGLRRLRDPGGYVIPRIHEDDSENLRSYLRAWLQQVGAPQPSQDAALPELLVQALIRGDIE